MRSISPSVKRSEWDQGPIEGQCGLREARCGETDLSSNQPLRVTQQGSPDFVRPAVDMKEDWKRIYPFKK